MFQNRSKNASKKRSEKQHQKNMHRAPFWTIFGRISEAFWSKNGVDGDLGSIFLKKAACGSYIVNPNEKSRFTGSEGTENRRRVDILGGKSGLKHGTATKGGQNGFWDTFWSILGSIWEAKTAQKRTEKRTEKRTDKNEAKRESTASGGGPAKTALQSKKRIYTDLSGKWYGFGSDYLI